MLHLHICILVTLTTFIAIFGGNIKMDYTKRLLHVNNNDLVL